MKAILKLAIVLAVLLAASGCWDSKTIQNLAYVTALGLDYKDGRFMAYVQVLNFLNVARSDKFEIGKNVPAWIGKGEGKTANEALSSLYATSQIKLYWGHIKAIVCSEALLKNKKALRQAYDAINRYHEVRYNILLFGTKEDFSEILSQKSLLYLSPLDTIMDTPEETYEQRSSIEPQYGYKNIAELNEKGRTIILPTISITKQAWQEDKKEKAMFQIDGAFAMHEHRLTGWFSEDDLKGVRWFNKRSRRVFVNIPDNENPAGALVLSKPRHRIQPLIEQDKVRFNVSIKVRAAVEEMTENVSIKEMEEQAAQAVRAEIESSYRKGLATQTDLLNLFGEIYRNDPEAWHRLNEGNRLVLKEDTLNKIEVKVKINQTGKYKGRTLPE
ncbi:Ger(x)C family spore germination protein [Paenibacillus arenilitoris]|uniref:Ger(X)C family spore germination protein n=1 Tax=Paenibacillus arenilitoris TaxID=2772299 RepID=A0A927H5B3_9BACL|nr:Ger(x)C family spore germination protein [Paenibacillus arenilitoris]MBD2868232.1 Ger(x)C family spore germination protein [Paenibacillus arenilitoris]